LLIPKPKIELDLWVRIVGGEEAQHSGQIDDNHDQKIGKEIDDPSVGHELSDFAHGFIVPGIKGTQLVHTEHSLVQRAVEFGVGSEREETYTAETHEHAHRQAQIVPGC
jgi:hypothetical protein